MKFLHQFDDFSSLKCRKFIKFSIFSKFIWWKFYNFLTKIHQRFDENSSNVWWIFFDFHFSKRKKRKVEEAGGEPWTLEFRVWHSTSRPTLLVVKIRRKLIRHLNTWIYLMIIHQTKIKILQIMNLKTKSTDEIDNTIWLKIRT